MPFLTVDWYPDKYISTNNNINLVDRDFSNADMIGIFFLPLIEALIIGQLLFVMNLFCVLV